MQFRDFAGCVRLVGYFALALLVTGALGDVWIWLSSVLHVPFHRVVDRALLTIIFGFVLCLEWRQFGFFWRRYAVMGELVKGALLAGGSVLLTLALGLLLDNWHLQAAQPTSSKMSQTLLALLFVPLLEETLFRGVAMGRLIQEGRAGVPYPVIALAAAIYAAAHFVRIPPDNGSTVGMTVWQAEGAALMGLSGLLSWRFLNLWLIGDILGILYWKTGRLWCSAGAHGVWIWALLLLPTWLHNPKGETDLSVTGWVTGPLGLVLAYLLLSRATVRVNKNR